MKIQCDACENAPATVICCADEAALCGRCDVEIHAANRLAGKHQRLLIDCLSDTLPRCDICQEKAAFIFCVEDRALFCQDCDEPIHMPGTISGNHRRFLATGIRVAAKAAMCNNNDYSEPPNDNSASSLVVPIITPTRQNPPAFTPAALAVDDFLQMSDHESTDKSILSQKEFSVGFGDLDWFADIGLFHDQAHKRGFEAAEVPEFFTNSSANNAAFHKPDKASMPTKKPRIVISDDDEEFFTVPDLG